MVSEPEHHRPLQNWTEMLWSDNTEHQNSLDAWWHTSYLSKLKKLGLDPSCALPICRSSRSFGSILPEPFLACILCQVANRAFGNQVADAGRPTGGDREEVEGMESRFALAPVGKKTKAKILSSRRCRPCPLVWLISKGPAKDCTRPRPLLLSSVACRHCPNILSAI